MKYKNYQKPEWNCLANLTGGCDKLLKKYHQKFWKTIRDAGGAAEVSDENNIRNWVSPEDVIRYASYAKYHNYLANNITIPVVLFDWKLSKENTIYLWLEGSHFYVFAHQVATNTCYFSDGGNYIATNSALRKTFGLRMKKKIRIITNNANKRLDYCGSSAVVIIAHLVKFMSTSHWPESFTVNRKLANPLRSKLHKHRSPASRENKTHVGRTLQCENCNKKFRVLRLLRLHQNLCQSRRSDITEKPP